MCELRGSPRPQGKCFGMSDPKLLRVASQNCCVCDSGMDCTLRVQSGATHSLAEARDSSPTIISRHRSRSSCAACISFMVAASFSVITYSAGHSTDEVMTAMMQWLTVQHPEPPTFRRSHGTVTSHQRMAYSPVPPGVSFMQFTSVSLDDVATAVVSLPNKSSALDPIPVPVLKAVSDLLAPFLTYMLNISVSSGRVPAAFKDSFVTPVI